MYTYIYIYKHIHKHIHIQHIYIFTCIYIYTYICVYIRINMFVLRVAHIKAVLVRGAALGLWKGLLDSHFPRRICAIAITCRIRAGHRVSAIPISAIRVRLWSRFSTRTRFTFAIPFSHSRDPILAIRIRPHDLDSPHDSHSLFAHSPHSGQAVAVRTEIRSRIYAIANAIAPWQVRHEAKRYR
jgi:hypothetical protein